MGRGSIQRGEERLDDLSELYRERRHQGRLRAFALGAWDLASLLLYGRWIGQSVPDLSAGWKYWAGRPGLALTSILTLGLGLGTGVTIYAIASGILFKPLSFRAPDRLALVWNTYPSWRGNPLLASRWNEVPLSWPEYVDVREHARSVEALALYAAEPVTVIVEGTAEQIGSARVSASFFELLGASLEMGRGFRPDDDETATGTAIVSHEFWRARLGGRPDVIDQVLDIGTSRATIVGVAPQGFSFRGESLWRPIGLDAPGNRGRDKHLYEAIARLSPGVHPAAALAELEPLLLGDRPPGSMGARIEPLLDDRVGGVRPQLLLVLAASLLLMAIAGINVSNLIVGDLAGRGRELAVKQALGASRWRLAREVIGANLLLAAAGGGIAIGVAALALPAVGRVLPAGTPRTGDIAIDAPVIAMAAAAALAAGLLCSLAPLALLARGAWQRRLSSAGRTVVDGGALQAGLVRAQIAITVVLLASSALLVRTFVELSRVDPGFRAEDVVTARLLPPAARYATAASLRELYGALMERVGRLEGVTAVTTSSRLPIADAAVSTSIGLPQRLPEAPRPEVRLQAVSPGYLSTLGVALTAGRDLLPTDVDGAPSVSLVSAAFARDHLEGNPIGQAIEWNDRTFTVVGVTGDVLDDSFDSGTRPAVYLSTEQVTVRNRWLVVKVSGRSTTAVESAIAQLVRSTDGQIVVSRLTTLSSILSTTLEPQRFRMAMVSSFAIVAGLLCCVGIHTAVARVVTSRWREIGVRVALGAAPRDVVSMLVKRSAGLVVTGAVVGIALSAGATRLIHSMLFGVSPVDPAAVVIVGVVLAGIAAVATVLPARRALAVNPVVALKDGSA